MKQLHKDAMLHEKTVQSAGETVYRGPARKRKRPRPGPVVESRVHPDAWAMVRQLLDSGCGYTRFEVVSLTEVVVR